MTLVPIHNLDTLNETQKVEYLKQVCEHFQLPAHLNLLEFINMEAGDGAKHMVLYAKKGATDMLRERHGISIVDLQQTITSQAAIFTAKAQDKNGRTEIAVGASSIENLQGRELANQIMIAQTRATRRVTLQFVGGGILDESEVFQSQTTNINSLAAATAPVSEAVSSIAKQPTQPAVNATVSKDTTESGQRTREQIEAQAVLDRMTAKNRLRRHTPTFSLQEEAGIEPTHHEPVIEIPQPAIKAATAVKEPDISIAPQVVAAILEPAIKADILHREPVPETSTGVPNSDTAIEAKAQEIAYNAAVQISADIPTEEQMKQFKTRLRVFTDEVFPQAGMVPSEGLGGVTMKVRLFAMARYKVLDLKKLTVAQWDDLFTYFDKTDAKQVVSEIEEAINRK